MLKVAKNKTNGEQKIMLNIKQDESSKTVHHTCALYVDTHHEDSCLQDLSIYANTC